MMMVDMEQPIDAVIMWVDGSSEAFRQSEELTLAEEKRKGKAVVHSAARHRDNGELRYLLRAIEHNMPWVRNIYVVTNGQKPDYVNFYEPGIYQVSHRDIFEDEAQLPCFNSFAIDSFLYRLEGLSEHFIRFSDDFFVGREISKQEFLDTHGAFIFTGRVQDEPKNRYQGQVKGNAELMEQVLGQRPKFNIAHAPQLRSRSVFQRFADTYGDVLNKTRGNRFRTRDDIMPMLLYPYYALHEAYKEDVDAMEEGMDRPMAHVPANAVTNRYAQVAVGQEGSKWEWKLKKVLETQPAFFNLNDSFGPDSIEDGVAVMDDFLKQMFPKPSRFEVKTSG